MEYELGHRHLQLESWTRDRLAEMRQIAGREAMLASLRSGAKWEPAAGLPWVKRMAKELGHTMINWGLWLQNQAGVPAAQIKQS